MDIENLSWEAGREPHAQRLVVALPCRGLLSPASSTGHGRSPASTAPRGRRRALGGARRTGPPAGGEGGRAGPGAGFPSGQEVFEPGGEVRRGRAGARRSQEVEAEAWLLAVPLPRCVGSPVNAAGPLLRQLPTAQRAARRRGACPSRRGLGARGFGGVVVGLDGQEQRGPKPGAARDEGRDHRPETRGSPQEEAREVVPPEIGEALLVDQVALGGLSVFL